MTTNQATAINIPFTLDNVKKCSCPQCPVQANSKCAQDKMVNIEKAIPGNAIVGRDIPAEYCAQGKAVCGDIDTKQNCICNTCTVWSSYNLSKADKDGYYCREGRPHKK